MSKFGLMKINWVILVASIAFVLVGGTSTQAQLITTFGSGANAFNIEFVEIGNPGNTADNNGSPNPAGSVGYVYNIGKYEISRDMIIKANAAGSIGITLQDMTSFGGNGVNRPATGISWNEAARFVNYLNTSKGYQAAYNFTTTGANDNITLWGAGQYSGSNQFRHKDAYYFLPSRDEWYKAAYGNPNGNWHLYANGSNASPVGVASGTSGVVWNGQSGPADITNAGVLSPYGTMAQNGNVYEWNESAPDGSNNSATENREVRGGTWANTDGAASSRLTFLGPTADNINNWGFGFRVASVPEPSAVSLLVVGLGGVMAMRRRRGAV